MTGVNSVTQAFMGDAVYELIVRCRLVEGGRTFAADRLHREAVRYVKAASQAAALRVITSRGLLSVEEAEVVRKARNRKPKTVPKNTDPVDYKLATGLEALLGFHYLAGRTERAEELVSFAMAIIDEGGI